MPRRSRIAAAFAAVAVAGAGAGAAAYDAVSGGSPAATTMASAVSPARIVNSTAGALSVNTIYDDSIGSIVEIQATTSAASNGQTFPFGGPNGGDGSSIAQGTGFVYDNTGHIVTNEHVISGATSVKVVFHDGSTRTATVVGSDPSTDVAVLKVDATGLQPLTLADSDGVAVGDGVVAIGSPYGLDGTVTTGIVSATGREIDAPDGTPIDGAIQTDAAINHGNSGGPLFDLTGKVIGITSQIQSDSGVNDGIGFAISSNLVKSIADQLIASGKVAHPLLGVNVQTIPASVASTLGEHVGAAITKVQSGSGGDKAGLKASTGTTRVGGTAYATGGDVIAAVDGTSVASAADLRAAIAAHAPGDTVTLTVWKGTSSRTVQATLGTR